MPNPFLQSLIHYFLFLKNFPDSSLLGRPFCLINQAFASNSLALSSHFHFPPSFLTLGAPYAQLQRVHISPPLQNPQISIKHCRALHLSPILNCSLYYFQIFFSTKCRQTKRWLCYCKKVSNVSKNTQLR
jgi:hypothetical protein